MSSRFRIISIISIVGLWFADLAWAQGLTDEQKRKAAKSSELSGLPVLFRTPETGAGIGGVLIFVPKQTRRNPEPVITGFMYTEKKQFLWAMGTKQYVGDSGLTVFGYAELLDYPQSFFGIGSSTDKDAEEIYVERRQVWELGIEYPVYSHLELGIGVRSRSSEFRDLEAGKMLDSGLIPGIDGGRQQALQTHLNWQTTDDLFYPGSGEHITFAFRDFPATLGSEYPFYQTVMDVRIYRTVLPKSILAFRGYWLNQKGEVPFYQLGQLGGHDLLRGYFKGRYRGRKLALAEWEWRQRISRRVALVGFMGGGDVADQNAEFKLASLKPSYGAGGRYQIADQQKINLRFDIGVGESGPQVYLYIMEAF